MSETITITGNVATDPTRNRTSSGDSVTNFRLASTGRRFDVATQRWVDTETNWYSIAAFRQLADHAKASLRTGDSVVVTGKVRIRKWENNGKHGTSVDVEAEAIGHDMRWGTSNFVRTPRQNASTERGDDVAATRSETGDSPADHDEQAPLDTAWAVPSNSADKPEAVAH